MEEINVIKNSMAILKENQDVLRSHILKTFNFVNFTYREIGTNRLLLRSLQKDLLQINSVYHLSKELKALYYYRIFFISYFS